MSEAAREKWLREQVVPTYDAAMADPIRALPAQETWLQLQEHMHDRIVESNAKKKSGDSWGSLL